MRNKVWIASCTHNLLWGIKWGIHWAEKKILFWCSASQSIFPICWGNLGENHATPKADGLFKMPQHGFFMEQPSPKWHPPNQKSCSKPGCPAYTTITDHKIHETRTGVQLLGMFVLNHHQPWLQHVATWFYMFYPLVNVYITMEHHHFLMGKSTISMAIFNSKLLVITRG